MLVTRRTMTGNVLLDIAFVVILTCYLAHFVAAVLVTLDSKESYNSNQPHTRARARRLWILLPFSPIAIVVALFGLIRYAMWTGGETK